MPYSTVSHIATGLTDTFNVPFPYLSQGHVKVYVAGVLKTVTTQYTWLSTSAIKLTVVPLSGQVVDIKRDTPKQTMLVEQQPSLYSHKDANQANLQLLYIEQEALDARATTAADIAALDVRVDDLEVIVADIPQLRIDVDADRIAAENAAAGAMGASGLFTVLNVAGLLANTTFSRTAGAGKVQLFPGNIIRTLEEGFSYEVTSASPVDEHVTTAGGLEFYILAVNGVVPFAATGAVSGAANHNTHWASIVAAAQFNGASEILFPPGEFRISYVAAPVTTPLRAKTLLRGAQWLTVIKPVSSGDRAIFGVDSGSAVTQVDGIAFEGLTFQGAEATPTFSEQKHLISLHGVKNLRISRCAFIGFRGDGLYLGSGDAGGVERHNSNVTVEGCLFDGVNKENRNGISIIDCDGFNISDNTFRNCTKSTMPGAIDVEPNGNAYHIAKNGNISRNQFSNIGGNVGAICFVLTATTFTIQPENFNVSGNVFDGVEAAVAMISNVAYANPLNISIVGNTGRVVRPWNMGPNINGFEIVGNIFRSTAAALLGFSDADIATNGVVANNNLKGPATTVGGMLMRSGSNVVFTGNVFAGFHDYDISIGGAASTVSNINVTGNHFGVPTGAARAIFGAGGIDGKSCVFIGNAGATLHTFPAWRTDNCGGVINGDATPPSFNADNLPDDFPVGECVCVINGDTAVPSGTGGFQGTLINYKYAATAGYGKWQWQEYYHAHNTTKLGSFFIRRRNNTANVWEAWSEQAT